MYRRALSGTLIALALIVGALGIRALLLDQPYHQDEYKWAQIVNPEYGLTGTLPHPPLSEFLYHSTGVVFGYDNLRILPFVVSGIFSILLFIFVRRFYGEQAALIALGLWAIDLYAVLASVQIDIDGVILPIFALLTFGGYEMGKREGLSRFSVTVLGIGVIGGFFTKLSFILVPAAIAADLVWFNRHTILSRVSVRTISLTLGALAIAAVGVFLLRDTLVFQYAQKFIFSSERNWFQLLFLSAKAAIYLSPLLVLGVLLGLRYLKDLSVWFWYIAASISFYAVVFDFTQTTMDRYWMVLILPFTIIVAVALSRVSWDFSRRDRVYGVIILALVAIAATYVFLLDKLTVPLQPKTAFIEAFVSGNWSILIPLTGGSGPLGFYLPLDGVLFLFAVALCSIGAYFFARSERTQRYALVAFVSAGFVYNVLGVVEYTSGYFYGSTPRVYYALLERVVSDPEIPSVITYYDTAAYELTEAGKYFKRLYTDPMFAESNIGKLATYRGYFFVLDMPEINKESVYWHYFESCIEVFKTTDKLVSGYVFDCRGRVFNTDR